MELVNKVIGTELALFEKKFAESVKSSKPLLDRIMRFIIKRKGKQMRPMFVFLSAKIAGELGERTYRAAGLIELLHPGARRCGGQCREAPQLFLHQCPLEK